MSGFEPKAVGSVQGLQTIKVSVFQNQVVSFLFLLYVKSKAIISLWFILSKYCHIFAEVENNITAAEGFKPRTPEFYSTLESTKQISNLSNFSFPNLLIPE